MTEVDRPWLMEKYAPLSTPDGEPDPAAYHRFFDPFYRGAFDAGRQVRIVHARQLHDLPFELAVAMRALMVAGRHHSATQRRAARSPTRNQTLLAEVFDVIERRVPNRCRCATSPTVWVRRRDT